MSAYDPSAARPRTFSTLRASGITELRFQVLAHRDSNTSFRNDTASDLPAATARRPWYQSIAGNLLVAFALIAALTVGATLLSLIRFNQIDAVMNRLTGVSLPAGPIVARR